MKLRYISPPSPLSYAPPFFAYFQYSCNPSSQLTPADKAFASCPAHRLCRPAGGVGRRAALRLARVAVEHGDQRTYNRQQHQRCKKDDTEYNRQVAQAQDIRDAYARGALDEEDAIARLIAIK